MTRRTILTVLDTTKAETKDPGRLTSEFLSGYRDIIAGVFVVDWAVRFPAAA